MPRSQCQRIYESGENAMAKVVRSYSLREDIAEQIDKLPRYERSLEVNKALDYHFFGKSDFIKTIVREVIKEVGTNTEVEVEPEVEDKINNSLAAFIGMRK